MELKKAVTVCLISLFAATLVVLIARALDMQAASSIQPELQKIAKELEAIRRQVSGGAGMQSSGDSPADLSDGVIVYYAHSNTRCPTCRKIEAQAYMAVTSGFGDALDDGSIRWEVVNYEEASGKHFVDDYGVLMPTVVLERMKDGKVAEGNQLDRVWGLRNDKPAFIEYVQTEIRKMQKAAVLSSPPKSKAPADSPPADIPIPDAVPPEDASPPVNIPIPDMIPSEDDSPAPLPAPITPLPKN